MNKSKINFKDDNLLILSLILFSIIISFSYPYLQYGVDGGLILADQIKYPNNKSPMLFYFLNSWTLIHQISYLFVKVGISVENISKILMFISTTSFIFGVLLFSYSITNIKSISCLISITAIVLGKNFGDTDYPSLIFSEHTYGMMSLAIFTLCLGLLANRNVLFACVALVTSIAIHPIIGIWAITVSFLGFYFSNIYKYYKKDIKTGVLIGVSLAIISFIFFYLNSIEKINYDQNLFNIYLDKWDGHRAISQNIHFDYLIKTFFLGILSYAFLKDKNNIKYNNLNCHILVLLISLFISTLLYLSFKLFPNYFSELIKILMPSRFIMLHTFLGWPLIISFLFFFISRKFNQKKLIKFLSIFLIIILFQNYKKIIMLSNNFLDNFHQSETSKIILYIENKDFDGYILTSSNLTSSIFKKAKKPILLHTDSMDFIPYHPYLVNKFFNIIERVYGIENFLPPDRNNPSLSDEYVKFIFEKSSKDQWIKIKNEFEIEYIITPKKWILNLETIMQDDQYKLYKIL